MTADAPDRAPPARPRPRRRIWWLVAFGCFVLFFELLAGQYVARPLRILRPSPDPDIVYESVPGNWLGRATYDVWKAPLFMILDVVMGQPDANATKPPPGYTLYRIDEDHCRLPTEGPAEPRADIVVMGSSQSFGLLVPAEETIVAYLESTLRGRGFSRLRIANCGVVGHHLIPSLRMAEQVFPRKQPRLFVTLVRPWHLTRQFDYTRVINPQNALVRFGIDHSNLARLLFYFARREGNETKARVPREELAAKLDRFVAATRGARAVFFFVEDERYQKEEKAMLADFADLLREKGLPFGRLSSPFAKRELYIDKEQHWSATGAAAAAAQIVDQVQAELIAAGAPPTP